MQDFGEETLKKGEHLEDLGVGGRTVSKFILVEPSDSVDSIHVA